MKFFLGFLAILPLVVDFAAERPYEPIKIVWFEIAVCAALVAALAAIFRRRRVHDLVARLGRLDAAAALFFAALAVGSVFSVDPVRSFWGSDERLTGLLFYACLLAAYLIVRLGARRDDLDFFWRVSVISAAVASVYGILQWLGHDFPGLSRAFPLYGQSGPMRAFSTLGHPVFLGNYLAMIAPFAALSAFRREESRDWRLFASLALVLTAFATAVTYSRGAWLGFAAALGAFFLLRSPRTKKFYARLAAASFIAAVFLAAGLFVSRAALIRSGNPFAYRVGAALSLSEGSGLTRFADARFALSLLAARPLTGYGPDTFMLYAVLRHKDPGERNRDWAEADPSVSDRIHDLELDTAWNGGVLALAALAFLIFSAASAVRGALRGRDRAAVAAVAACLIAYFVTEQLAFDFSASAIMAWTALAGLALLSEV